MYVISVKACMYVVEPRITMDIDQLAIYGYLVFKYFDFKKTRLTWVYVQPLSSNPISWMMVAL